MLEGCREVRWCGILLHPGWGRSGSLDHLSMHIHPHFPGNLTTARWSEGHQSEGLGFRFHHFLLFISIEARSTLQGKIEH